MKAHAIDFSDTKRARDRLMTDLQTVLHDSEELLKATAHDVGDAAQEARSRLRKALDRARSTCAEWQEQGIETAREAAKSTDAAIRSHPYESVAVALGVGILIGALWRNR